MVAKGDRFVITQRFLDWWKPLGMLALRMPVGLKITVTVGDAELPMAKPGSEHIIYFRYPDNSRGFGIHKDKLHLLDRVSE